jgi:hypothetical protein
MWLRRWGRKLQYIGLGLLALATACVIFIAMQDPSWDVPQLWEMTGRILPPKDK